MARRKKPENETGEQSKQRQILELISNFSTRSEKTSWNRKMDNMVKLISQLVPIEEKMLYILKTEKQPILDDIENLRVQMVRECIHPFEQLVFQQGSVLCKFCSKKMALPNGSE